MSRTAFLVTSALAVAALGFQVSSAYADHSWGNYHWERSSNPLSLKLGENVSDKWKVVPSEGFLADCNEMAYLQVASCDWSLGQTVVDTTVVTGGANPKNCKATDGRVEVCSERYGNNGWLGLAQIWISGSHITKAIVKLNDFYFDMANYDKPKWRFYAMCHEVGHTFGLGHRDETSNNVNLGSCLDYTNDPAPVGKMSNEHPDKHDYDELELIYEHLDEPTNTVSRPGKGNGRGNGKVVSVSGFEFANYVRDDPDDWGTAVAFTSKGQPRLFVKNLGEGEKRITHVLWTEDARAGAHFPHQH